MRVQPAAATAAGRAGENPHSLSRPSQIVEVPVVSTTIIREIVLDADTSRSDANSKSEPPTSLSPPVLASELSLGKAEDKPDRGRDKEGPTMAEVRAWVAEPLQQLAELQALQAIPSRPLPAQESSAREPVEPSREVYALEIGTMEIVLDSPSASSPPPRSQVAAPAEPSDAQRNRASRHYLRF
jgi:hypothetical protein